MWKHEVPSPSERVSLKMRATFVKRLDRASRDIRKRTDGKAVISRSRLIDEMISRADIETLVEELSR
jgi:hypothetical protein